MTQLSTICGLASNLPRSQRAAIISLIDLKTEGDMQKVLDKLDLMEQRFDAKFDAMEQKFDAKFDVLNNKISMTQWFVVIVLTLLTVIVAIPKLG